MLSRFSTGTRAPTGIRPRSPNLCFGQRFCFCHLPPRASAPAMDAGVQTSPLPPPPPSPSSSSPRQKRPFCARCSKASSVCLCSRFRSPPLDNAIGVTILQHSLEGKHALNSARVASLGLRNVAVVPVTDVLFHADLTVRPLDPPVCSGDPPGEAGVGKISNAAALRGGIPGVALEQNSSEEAVDSQFRSKRSDFYWTQDSSGAEEQETMMNSASCKVICSSSQLWISLERTAKPDLTWVLERPFGKIATSNGFAVQKLQRRQLKGCTELEEIEEFEIVIPPGAALLFPGKSSIELGAVDFEVKHLIVLDGTWDKAKRMYYENPWLQFLPHLKLELKTASLYSEVRHQPRPGCFSTIESIVYALKALGNDTEGLDGLLDVFKSMIGDQRRCKDEKFRRMAQS